MLRLALHWQILIAMVIGAAVGLALNFFAGTYQTPEPQDVQAGEAHPYGFAQPVKIPDGSIWVHDVPGRIQMQIVEERLEEDEETGTWVPKVKVRRVFVGPLDPPPISTDAFIDKLDSLGLLAKEEAEKFLAKRPAKRRPTDGRELADALVRAGRLKQSTADRVLRTFPKLAEIKDWPPLPEGYKGRPGEVVAPSLGKLKSDDPVAYTLFLQKGRSTARTTGDLMKMIGDLFLRMLKMVSVPLIIFSLISGVMGLGGAERLGKMFGRTVLYYVSTSMLAICTGLIMFNLIDPGAPADAETVEAVSPEDEEEQAPPEKGKSLPTVLFEQIEALIPTNPAQAVANSKFLSIIAFSLAFGIFATILGGKTAEFVGQFANAGFAVMMKLTMAIIALAPAGVLCLMLYATATQGIGVFGRLGMYMLTVACALGFHAVVVLPLLLKFIARRSPWEFAKAMSPALFTAFSSASSNATLPLTLTSVEERAGVSNKVSSFVLPLGATVNMDGTALYEVIAVLFIANLTPGVDLAFYEQLIVAFTALLASVGAAGIPHAGLVMMVIILQAVGLPTEAQGLIIAVDRILDMCRTAVNVWSDSCGCAVIARFEGDGEEAGDT